MNLMLKYFLTTDDRRFLLCLLGWSVKEVDGKILWVKGDPENSTVTAPNSFEALLCELTARNIVAQYSTPLLIWPTESEVV